MKGKKIIVLGCFILFILILLICIFIVKHLNIKKEKTTEKIIGYEKIAAGTILISSRDSISNTITTKDLIVSKEQIKKYEELINSSLIKEKIKEKYSDVHDIEMESLSNTEVVKLIYVCDKYTENECIDIINKYIYEFSDAMKNMYNIEINIVDNPEIYTRTIELNR